MKLKSIQINGFGKIKDTNIEFEDGINVVIGPNESGKSTIVDFIKGILYGVNRNKAGSAFSEYEHFKPWEDAEFSGKLTYESKGETRSIFRDFNRNSAKIYNKDGDDITKNFNKDKSRGAEIGIEELGIDEETFVTTALARQEEVGVDLSSQKTLLEKLTNMIQSGSENSSYEDVCEKLEKLLYEEVGTDRTANKPKNVTLRAIAEKESQRDLLIDKRHKEEMIKNELEKKLRRRETLLKEKEDAKKVYDIREKYQNQLTEKRVVYEAEQKVIERQKAEKEKKLRNEIRNDMIAMAVLALAVVAVSIFTKKYLALLTLIPIAIACIVFSKKTDDDADESTEINKFDLIVEELKKKENIEIQRLEEEGIKRSLLDRKIAELKTQIDGYEKSLNDNILQEHKLALEQETLTSGINKLNEIEEDLENLYAKKNELKETESMIKLTIQVLDESYQELRDEVIPEIIEEIQKTVEYTTNGQYKNIKYNDTNGLVIENKLGQVILVSKLSIGTIDQIYLGFRLALANKIGNVPIILDEAFCHYDENRLMNVVHVLEKIAKEHQIIILSCNHMEAGFMEAEKIKYNLIKL